jgi:hypothetical protein
MSSLKLVVVVVKRWNIGLKVKITLFGLGGAVGKKRSSP